MTGSFAVSYYGIPRATHDIDFVIGIEAKGYKRLKDAFNELGESFLADQKHIEKVIKETTSFDVLPDPRGFDTTVRKDCGVKRLIGQDLRSVSKFSFRFWTSQNDI